MKNGSSSDLLKQKTMLLRNNVAVHERARELDLERKRSFPPNSGSFSIDIELSSSW